MLDREHIAHPHCMQLGVGVQLLGQLHLEGESVHHHHNDADYTRQQLDVGYEICYDRREGLSGGDVDRHVGPIIGEESNSVGLGAGGRKGRSVVVVSTDIILTVGAGK